MSRANMVVRLADGSIRYGIYNGTVDVCWRPLFDNQEEAWKGWNIYYSSVENILQETPISNSPIQEAIIYSDYGGGFWFPGKASMDRIIEPTVWDDFEENMTDGRPDWLTEEILPRY